MKAYVLEGPGGIDSLKLVERPTPEPGPGEVLVRVRACSLNYRDHLALKGGYGSRQKQADLIPLSDGAGEIAAVGPGVSRFQPGDRVLASFFMDWLDGEPTDAGLLSALGGKVDGMLTEYRVLPQHAVAKTPEHLSDVEAAALPCAALTAWSAVIRHAGTKPGDVVLTQGTGGVSLFALQFAKLAGAQVIATSSSNDKLERVRKLGADHVINYREDEEWGRTANSLTGGRGVDLVVEVGGGGTLKQSMRAARVGGPMAMIGVLAGARQELNLPLVVMQDLRLQGVTVGSIASLEKMLAAIRQHGMRPVIDRVFPFTDVAGAFAHMAAGKHFGKVCVTVGEG